jgi:2-C-methyl-D-erythritol 4-phosphate cytidylyltransferase
VALVVMAAGTGSRFGHHVNKVFLPLSGRAVVTWSLASGARAPGVTRLVLVAAERDRDLAADVLERYVPGLDVELVAGGTTRHASEQNGLQALAADIRSGDLDIVMIHDAARPLASTDLFAAVIAEAHVYGGAVPVRPYSALVRVDGTALAPDRDIVAVQTPQAFSARLLLAAYERAEREDFTGTDTASCVEAFSDLSIRCVAGSARNLKITYLDDLAVAEHLLRR